MRFNKFPSTVDEQIALLRERGMEIPDEDHARRCLGAIGYYRLSAYWLSYEELPKEGRTRSKVFVDGTNFDEIYDLYVFD